MDISFIHIFLKKNLLLTIPIDKKAKITFSINK